MRRIVTGHVDEQTGRIQSVARYSRETFEALIAESDRREVSVNQLVNEAVKKYLGVV